MSTPNLVAVRDKVWEEVLELLSSQGRLNKFFKLPRHEKRAILQLYGHQSYANLGTLFHFTQKNDIQGRAAFLAGQDDYHLYAMLNVMVRSMQCWSETEGTIHQRTPARWRIAHA
ncbi:MAG: hypothetical protein ABIR96_02080 [Bdellovibrionota bacterium]